MHPLAKQDATDEARDATEDQLAELFKVVDAAIREHGRLHGDYRKPIVADIPEGTLGRIVELGIRAYKEVGEWECERLGDNQIRLS